ncbi:MAG: flippase, partial [Clostridia bacterium]|nr:flippase [Clostridia bacterium]
VAVHGMCSACAVMIGSYVGQGKFDLAKACARYHIALATVISLVVGVLSARYLGPSNYGTLNYTLSFVTFFVSVATLGMDSLIVKKLVESPDREGEYLGSCMLLRFISSVLSTLVIGLVVFVLNPSEPIKVTLALIQSLQLIFRSGHLFEGWFQRHLKSKYVAIAKMVASVVVSGYKIFLLITAKDIVWFAFANVMLEGICVLIFASFYKAEKGQRLVAKISTGKEVFSQSYHFILSGLMVAIYTQMDKIMIGSILTDAAVGLYTTALTICAMWIFVPTAIINSYQVRIYELKKEGKEEEYLDRLKRLYGVIIWLCLIVSAIVTVFADLGVHILYGEEYAGASGVLKIAIWSEVFSMIGVARGIWIVNEGKQKYVKYYLLFGALINLVLNATMIPWIGIYGAALATLITQIVTSVVSPLFFKETRAFTKIVAQSFILLPFWKKEKKYESEVDVKEE